MKRPFCILALAAAVLPACDRSAPLAPEAAQPLPVLQLDVDDAAALTSALQDARTRVLRGIDASAGIDTHEIAGALAAVEQAMRSAQVEALTRALDYAEAALALLSERDEAHDADADRESIATILQLIRARAK